MTLWRRGSGLPAQVLSIRRQSMCHGAESMLLFFIGRYQYLYYSSPPWCGGAVVLVIGDFKLILLRHKSSKTRACSIQFKYYGVCSQTLLIGFYLSIKITFLEAFIFLITSFGRTIQFCLKIIFFSSSFSFFILSKNQVSIY